MARVRKGPNRVQLLDPVLKAVKQLGGSGRPAEVIEIVARLKKVSDAERQETLPGGALRFDKEVAFARTYLVWAGYLDASKRGVWSLTEKGMAAKGLSDSDAHQLFKEQNALRGPLWKKGDETKEDGKEEESLEVQESYKERFLSILQNLPPAGFERFCQRLLRESGFEQVEVTGQPGDGGIDGFGIVKVNPFVTFKVLFQCRRYKGAVSPSQVRDFRGAMEGRVDKGIILTTGSFTKDAQREAVREGVKQIELVDAEKLIDLCVELELGLLPQKTYELDTTFFEQFRAGA